MHNILIVEDNPEQNRELRESIHDSYPNWKISSAYSFEEANDMLVQSIHMNDYFSMFLLDVQLKDDPCDFGGFVLANEIRSQKAYYTVPILFLTSVSEKTSYALSNFHCYNYITKPYSPDDVIGQIHQMLMTGFLETNSIRITDTDRIQHRIVQQDICYIESKSHLVIINTTDGSITSRETSFSSLKEQLTGDFVQCHKKYIVNLAHIDNYDRQNRLLRLGIHLVPVSRTYKETLENLLRKKNLFEEK
ncbi:MAG: LytTR family DNA-binding domain-containing protein [Clostridium sp.]|nr:LytTR family DNA-binding domain-containing protein [Clostridium sp.]